jgi:beta-xylosidase
MINALAFIASMTLIAACGFAASVTIKPGEIWPDDRGQHIQAHGGGMLKVGDTFYWFGEYRMKEVVPGKRFVGIYCSKDLGNWTFRKRLEFANPLKTSDRFVLERPKVYFNEQTRKFVMYFHLDDARYAAARVGVAISDTVDGDYKLVDHFRPLGHESRDIGQFIDDDGTAYLIFEDRPNGFHIARLSDDYLKVEKDICLIRAKIEGGAIIRHDGLYYVLGSALTGWNPNPNKYATAKNLAGPWSEWKDIAPPREKTYGSQSTMLFKVIGTKATTVILMGDMWKQGDLQDSRYLWMPVESGGGNLHLPRPSEWTIDVETGEAVVKPRPASTSQSAASSSQH